MPDHDINQTISYMLNKGVDFIAITNNEKDINVYERKNKTKITIPIVNAVDTLGAGDVLHCAFHVPYQGLKVEVLFPEMN